MRLILPTRDIFQRLLSTLSQLSCCDYDLHTLIETTVSCLPENPNNGFNVREDVAYSYVNMISFNAHDPVIPDTEAYIVNAMLTAVREVEQRMWAMKVYVTNTTKITLVSVNGMDVVIDLIEEHPDGAINRRIQETPGAL